MITLDSMMALLGWCTAINFALFATFGIMLMLAGKPLAQFHSRLFGLNVDELPSIYFNYLAHYKILIVVFNLVPYLALRLIV
jgi:hypothetical protein